MADQGLFDSIFGGQGTGPGLLGNLAGVADNALSNPLMMLSLGLMTGATPAEGFRSGLGAMMATKKQRDEQQAYLQLVKALQGEQGAGVTPPQGLPSQGAATPSIGMPPPSNPPGTFPVGVMGLPPGEVPDLRQQAPSPSGPPATFNNRFGAAAPSVQNVTSVPTQGVPPLGVTPPPANPAGRNVNALLAALMNPNLNEGARKGVEAMVNQAMKDNALTDTQKEYLQFRMQNPKSPLTIDQFALVKQHPPTMGSIYGPGGTEQKVKLDPLGNYTEIGGPAMSPEETKRQEAAGTARGAIQTSLPGAVESGQFMLSTIDKAINHPGLYIGTGMTGVVASKLPGSTGYDFASVIDQIKGGAFLSAYEKLKGSGQITEVEGKKATEAIAQLDIKQSDTALKSALRDLRQVIQSGLNRSMIQAGRNQSDIAPIINRTGPNAPRVIPDLLQEARDAIAQGAPRDAVIKQLRALGGNPAGL